LIVPVGERIAPRDVAPHAGDEALEQCFGGARSLRAHPVEVFVSGIFGHSENISVPTHLKDNASGSDETEEFVRRGMLRVERGRMRMGRDEFLTVACNCHAVVKQASSGRSLSDQRSPASSTIVSSCS
jgi:hypothetical protein